MFVDRLYEGNLRELNNEPTLRSVSHKCLSTFVHRGRFSEGEKRSGYVNSRVDKDYHRITTIILPLPPVP